MDRLRRSLSALSSPRGLAILRGALLAGAVAVGALDTWFFRQWNLNPDGVSYVDLARAFALHGPSALLNGYWSPLYPALIGTGLKLVAPNADWMYPLVRFIGFVVYLVTVMAFDRFVRIVMARRSPPAEPKPWTEPLVLTVAWALFFLLVSQAIGLVLVTPDMGVAAIVFFVAGELVALATAPWRTTRWVRFAAVLAVGYWWKAILFPVGGVALGIAAALAWKRRDARTGVMASGATLALLTLALAIPVSMHVGRATFGETGRLNTLWYVNHAQTIATLCLPRDGRLDQSGVGPIRRETVLVEHPLTCSSDDRWPQATLPLWYDPSPWYANAAVRIDASETRRAMLNNVRYLRSALAESAPLTAIAIVITLILALGARAPLGPGLAAVAFAVAPIGAYLLVYVELRHVVPFLLCIAIPVLVVVADRRRAWARGALLAVAAAVSIDATVRLVHQQRVEAAIAVHEALGATRTEQHSVRVARALAARGLKPGDRVATINTLWNVDWAQRGGFVVRAYLPELTYPIDRTLLELHDPCIQRVLAEALRTLQIRAIVLKDSPAFASPGWLEPLGDTGYRVRLLDTPDPEAPRCAPPATRSSSETAAR